MKLNKKQKRTATIASMAALLAVVLGMGGQTFAKYVETNKIDADTAVVAKWGYVIQATSTADDGATDAVELFSKGDGTLVTSTDAVVAPGMSATSTYTVTGWSQVKAKLSLTIADVKQPSITSGVETYYPIEWELKVDSTSIYKGRDVAAMVTAATSADFNTAAALPAKATEPATFEMKISITWEWAFDNTSYNSKANTFDTVLGLYAESGATTGEFTYKDTSYTGINVEVGYSSNIEIAQVQA